MNLRTVRTVLASMVVLGATLATTGTATATTGTANGATVVATRPSPPPSCRGEGVDPGARIHYRAETVINASLSTVWRLQTDVERWPTWQPPVGTAERLDRGALKKGSRFWWTTPVPATDLSPATTLVITSTVHQLERRSCVRWSGPAIGEGLRIDRGVHVWTFTKVRGGVLVRTEETWTGAQVEADVAYSTAALGLGLEAWLQDLKAAAEASARHPR